MKYNADEKINIIQAKLNGDTDKLDYCEEITKRGGYLIALDEEKTIVLENDNTNHIVVVCNWEESFLTITDTAVIYFTKADYNATKADMINDLIVNQRDTEVSAY